jgi:hypothetical protein
MTTEEQIVELTQEISDIDDEMMSEKSVSVDGKITVSRRNANELSAILSKKQQELDTLNGISATSLNLAFSNSKFSQDF